MKKILLAVAAALLVSGCSVLSFLVDTATDTESRKTSVVVIGVENGYAGKCSGALKDAKSMKSLLSKYSKDVKVLTDATATAFDVTEAIENAVKNKLAIIYFSGHGGSQPGGDEIDGNDEYICCYDGPIMDDEIWDMICESTGRVLLIFDCCHSETMFKSPGFQFKQAQKVAAGRNASVPNMLCWSGCPDSSYSYGDSSGGKFTNVLVDNSLTMYSYKTVWSLVSSNLALKKHQKVKQTKLGKFDVDDKVFR